MANVNILWTISLENQIALLKKISLEQVVLHRISALLIFGFIIVIAV